MGSFPETYIDEPFISCCHCTFTLTRNVRRVKVDFKLDALTRRSFFSPCVLVSYELSWLSCCIYRLYTK